MSNQITIREATEVDYEAVQALYQQMLHGLAERFPAQYKSSGADLGLPKQTFLDTLIDPNWTLLVAELEGATVGVLQLSVDGDSENDYRPTLTYAWIEELIIAPNQTDVVALITTMIQAAEAWAKDRGVSSLDIIHYAFREDLTAPLAALGYETVSTRRRKTL